VELGPDELVGARLAALGVDAGRIDWLVSSHLHFDHAGGNAQVPNARWVVQEREWQAGRDPEASAANHFDAKDWDLGHDVLRVDGEHDLFGDGSVVCLPTPGHTPGHQSLRVRPGTGPGWVFTADACYTREHMDGDSLSGVVWDPDAMARSLRRLRALRDEGGASVVYGHDAAQWASLPQAPRPLVGA
jgi:glyoxylase-like metal-dependent hydrolase (beta-lactamase superfamily II)